MKTDRKHPASPELRSLIQTLIKIDRSGSVLWHDKAASSECLMWGQRPKDSEHQPLLSQVQWYSVGAKAEQLGTLIGARTCEVTTAAPVRGIVFFNCCCRCCNSVIVTQKRLSNTWEWILMSGFASLNSANTVGRSEWHSVVYGLRTVDSETSPCVPVSTFVYVWHFQSKKEAKESWNDLLIQMSKRENLKNSISTLGNKYRDTYLWHRGGKTH